MTELQGHHRTKMTSASPDTDSLVDRVLSDARTLVGRRLSDYHRTMLVEVVHTLPAAVGSVAMTYTDGALVFTDTEVVDSVRRSAILAFPEFRLDAGELRLAIG